MLHPLLAEIDALREFAEEQTLLHPHWRLDDCIREFRRHQQVAKFNRLMEESLAQAARGESHPLDADDLKRRVRERLAREGIVD